MVRCSIISRIIATVRPIFKPVKTAFIIISAICTTLPGFPVRFSKYFASAPCGVLAFSPYHSRQKFVKPKFQKNFPAEQKSKQNQGFRGEKNFPVGRFPQRIQIKNDKKRPNTTAGSRGRTRTHTHGRIRTHLHTRICVYACAHAYAHTCTRTHTHTSAPTDTHIHMLASAHMGVHTRTHGAKTQPRKHNGILSEYQEHTGLSQEERGNKHDSRTAELLRHHHKDNTRTHPHARTHTRTHTHSCVHMSMRALDSRNAGSP